MKPDGTDSFSTADGSRCSHGGIHVTEPDTTTGPEIKERSEPEAAEEVLSENVRHQEPVGTANSPEKIRHHEPDTTTWSYIFVHNSRVKVFEEQLTMDDRSFFVHKTLRYFKKDGNRRVQKKEMPTISGLIFMQGRPEDIQAYLDDKFPQSHLCKNCSTGRVAQIADSQMRPFMRINAIAPERIRFLLRPFHYYARNRILLRITSGELAGLEGYVIRIDRDRRLVMDVGGMSVAVSGVHAEKFEEVERGRGRDSRLQTRNLQERQALIDRYFHPIKTPEDITAQAENISYLRRYVESELAQGRMRTTEAWTTYSFIIEEIAYYYAPFVEQLGERLNSIMEAGRMILHEMDGIIGSPQTDGEARRRYETDRQEIMLKYGYLF